MKTEVGDTRSSMASERQPPSELHSVKTEVDEAHSSLASIVGERVQLYPTMTLRCCPEQHRALQGCRDRPRLLLVAEVLELVSQAFLQSTSSDTPDRISEGCLVDPDMA